MSTDHGPEPDVSLAYDEDDGWTIDIDHADVNLVARIRREDDETVVVAAIDSKGPSFELRSKGAGALDYYSLWRGQR